MLGAPKVKAIRGFSDFGYSYVYVIFEDGTDLYWARSRTLEYLSKILPRLPEGRAHGTGPGRHRRRLGLPVRAGGQDRARTSWPSCVASRTGTCATTSDRCRAWPRWRPSADSRSSTRSTSIPTSCWPINIPITKVVEAIRDGNNDVGGATGRVQRRGVHGPRAGLRRRASATSSRSSSGPTSRDADPASEPGSVPRAGNPPRHRRPRRRGRHGGRHRHHAPAKTP